MTVPDVYIVGKGQEWMVSFRPDLLQMPRNHMWSVNRWDAKRFRDCKDARKRAKEYCGKVYRFSMVTGRAEPMEQPKEQICDTCRMYTAFDGACKNGSSEYYGVPVSIRDSCGAWEERT